MGVVKNRHAKRRNCCDTNVRFADNSKDSRTGVTWSRHGGD